MGSKVVCPFFRVQRVSYMRMPADGFCDNLRSGVPLCIVNGFFENWDEEFERACMEFGETEARIRFNKPDVERCGSVVLTDVYDAHKGVDCFFGGGLCVRPLFGGFGGCRSCSRWKVE
jgi:hypothetical protein